MFINVEQKYRLLIYKNLLFQLYLYLLKLFLYLMNTKKRDEIDLKELIVYILSVLRKWKIIFISTLSLSVLIGLYQSFKLKPSYISSSTVIFNGSFTNQVESSVFNSATEVCLSISRYIESSNYESLSKLIETPINEVEAIKNIQLEDIVPDKRFKIHITSVKEINTNLFFEGVVKAINNSDYVNHQNYLNYKRDSILYDELINQITQIDSSLKYNKLNADAIDNIYEHRFNLIEKRQKLQESMSHENSFYIGPSTNNLISVPNKIKEFLKYFIAGFVFTLSVIIFLEFRKYIKGL